MSPLQNLTTVGPENAKKLDKHLKITHVNMTVVLNKELKKNLFKKSIKIKRGKENKQFKTYKNK